MPVEHNIVRKNLFLRTCCGDDRITTWDGPTFFSFGAGFGWRESDLDFVFCFSEVNKMHAVLHDADGTMRSRTSKRLGHCYMIGPNSCSRGHVTWVNFLILRKTLSALQFQIFHFWSSMSCITLIAELKLQMTTVWNWKFLLMLMFSKKIFVVRKKFKLRKRAFWCTRKFQRIAWNSGGLDYSELTYILPEDVRIILLQKDRKSLYFQQLNEQICKKMDDHCCPNSQKVADPNADEKLWVWWKIVCLNEVISFAQDYTFRRVESKNVWFWSFGQWSKNYAVVLWNVISLLRN